MSGGSKKLKILVCDDRKEECERYAKAVEKICGIEPTSLYEDGLKDALEQLECRANAIVKQTGKQTTSPFDDAALVFIDYRLEQLDQTQFIWPTAENVIGKIRAFAGARYIVSLNVLPNVDFDLKDLFGARKSVADLAIDAKNLSEPALWGKGAGKNGFHPSYWPNLVRAHERRTKQIAAIRKRLDAKVLEHLGFEKELRGDWLPIDALSSLFPLLQEKDPWKATFFDLFETAAEDLTLEITKDVADRAADSKADFEVFRDVVARMCAYKVERWLRLHVLGPQDILVDLPHLIDRAPQILGKTRLSDPMAWNEVAVSDDLSKLDNNFRDSIEKATFEQSTLWFDQLAFWWTDLAERDEIAWPDFDEEARSGG